MDAARIQQLIPQLYALVAELEAAAPGRSFAPDGHLLGSIGEAMAASRYGLELTTASTKGVDAHAADGRPVEIKCTGAKSIALRGAAPSEPGLHLLALQVAPDGSVDEVYNGPAAPVWAAAGKLRDNGQRQISTRKLLALQAGVEPAHRLEVVG